MHLVDTMSHLHVKTEAGPDTIYLWFYNASNLVCTQSNCSDGIYTFNVTDEGKFKLVN